MGKISLMFTTKAVEHSFKHWNYSGTLWSLRNCDKWHFSLCCCVTMGQWVLRDARWENISGRGREGTRVTLPEGPTYAVSGVTALVLRTWSQ